MKITGDREAQTKQMEEAFQKFMLTLDSIQESPTANVIAIIVAKNCLRTAKMWAEDGIGNASR